MSDRSNLPSNAQVPFIAPYLGGIGWADTYARLAEGWFEWQYALWQPLMDAQAEWMRQWSEQSGWPMSQAVSARGSEQLA